MIVNNILPHIFSKSNFFITFSIKCRSINDCNEFLKDVKKGLPYIITCEVCASIVGESYAKWDSVSMYYPTLVFVFNEVTDNINPRRSQIKLRLKKTTDELNDSDV